MTCLVLTRVIEINAHVFQATFTDEESAATAVTQFNLRGNAPLSGRFAKVVDPITGDCRPALAAHSASDVLACVEEDAVDAAALEVGRAAQGGAVPPSTSDPIRAVAEATARERLRQAIARAAESPTGGAS